MTIAQKIEKQCHSLALRKIRALNDCRSCGVELCGGTTFTFRDGSTLFFAAK